MTLDLSNPEHREALRFVREHFDRPEQTGIQAELIEAVLDALSSPQNACTLLSDIVTDRGYWTVLGYVGVINGQVTIGVLGGTSFHDGVERLQWPLGQVHTLILALLDATTPEEALRALRSIP